MYRRQDSSNESQHSSQFGGSNHSNHSQPPTTTGFFNPQIQGFQQYQHMYGNSFINQQQPPPMPFGPPMGQQQPPPMPLFTPMGQQQQPPMPFGPPMVQQQPPPMPFGPPMVQQQPPMLFGSPMVQQQPVFPPLFQQQPLFPPPDYEQQIHTSHSPYDDYEYDEHETGEYEDEYDDEYDGYNFGDEGDIHSGEQNEVGMDGAFTYVFDETEEDDEVVDVGLDFAEPYGMVQTMNDEVVDLGVDAAVPHGIVLTMDDELDDIVPSTVDVLPNEINMDSAEQEEEDSIVDDQLEDTQPAEDYDDDDDEAVLPIRRSDNKDHFKAFLHNCVEDEELKQTEDFRRAEACALILDHNSYEKVHNVLPEKYSDVSGIPNTGKAQDYITILYAYIKGLGKETSEMVWGDLTSYGTGTSARAKYAKDGHAEGSPTSKKTNWMNVLQARRDGTKTLYALGHLINADLGGPGLDYNYVPLTQRAGWYGANDANGIHSKGIEQIVKSKYEDLGEDVSELTYEVEAVYDRGPRTQQINTIQRIIDAMPAIESEMTDEDVEEENESEEFEDIDFSSASQINRLSGATKKLLYEKIDKIPRMETVLNAVSPNNFKSTSWNKLKGLLAANLELWKYEDEVVPSHLVAKANWVQQGMSGEESLEIPIELPYQVDAPYNSKTKTPDIQSPPAKHENQTLKFAEKNSNISEDSSDEGWTSEMAARLLDINEYEREEMMSHLMSLARKFEIDDMLLQDNLGDQEREELTAERDSLESAINVLGQYIGFARFLKNPAVLEDLVVQLGKTSGELHSEVLNYVKKYNDTHNTNKSFSTINYSGKSPWGSPTKVVAYLQPNGHPDGSSAGGDPEWMLRLEERSDGKTVYVRGHMLNRNLGGAGLDYNMVPLTGRDGWYGANNANGIHSNGIEEIVKRLYSNLKEPDKEDDGSKVTNLVYSVEAVFENHSRPQTAMIEKLKNDFDKDIYKHIKQDSKSEQLKKSDDELINQYADLEVQNFVNLVQTDRDGAKNLLLSKLSEPTLTQCMNNLSQAGDAPHALIEGWRTNISVPSAEKLGKDGVAETLMYDQLKKIKLSDLPKEYREKVIEVIESHPYLSDVLYAITQNDSGDYEEDSLSELSYNMENNLELWKHEDEYVPKKLIASVSWTHQGSDFQRTFEIKNILPSDLKAPYLSRS